MRAVYSQLATFEAEVSRLTETQASAQEEWRSKTSHLQSELHQATAQKVCPYNRSFTAIAFGLSSLKMIQRGPILYLKYVLHG